MNSEMAIDAQGLVKKFPRRSNGENGNKPAENGGQEPKEQNRKKFSLRRQPVDMFTAVAGVDLQIRRGEVFGLLGPNGAGKSTTIRMLCTLLEPTSGTALVNGFDIRRQANQVRQSLGTVLGGERSIYWKLTARENLEYYAALYHIPADIARRRVSELLSRMELTARANDLVEKYSTGMKQRVAIARALLANPPIVLMDEPTLGLDPQAARWVREIVTQLKAEGHTVLLTTHYMEEADLLSDRIGIIDQGKVIALDTPAVLKRQIHQKDIIRLEVSGWTDKIATSLQQIPNLEHMVARHMGTDSLWEVSFQVTDSRRTLPLLLENVNQNGTRLVNLNVVEPSLEDVFIHLTGKALRD